MRCLGHSTQQMWSCATDHTWSQLGAASTYRGAAVVVFCAKPLTYTPKRQPICFHCFLLHITPYVLWIDKAHTLPRTNKLPTRVASYYVESYDSMIFPNQVYLAIGPLAHIANTILGGGSAQARPAQTWGRFLNFTSRQTLAKRLDRMAARAVLRWRVAFGASWKSRSDDFSRTRALCRTRSSHAHRVQLGPTQVATVGTGRGGPLIHPPHSNAWGRIWPARRRGSKRESGVAANRPNGLSCSVSILK